MGRLAKIQAEADAGIEGADQRADRVLSLPAGRERRTLEAPDQRSAGVKIPLGRCQEFELDDAILVVECDGVMEAPACAFDSGRPLARAEPVGRDDILIELRIATLEPGAEPRDLGNPRLQTRGGASSAGATASRRALRARTPVSGIRPRILRRIGIGRTVRQQTLDDVQIVRHRQEGQLASRLRHQLAIASRERGGERATRRERPVVFAGNPDRAERRP